MRSSIVAIIPLTLIASAMASPSIAHAETPRAAVATIRTEPNGYGYEFTDDGLLGGGNSAYGTTLVAPHRFARTLLIRPRIQFVAEMLKSVEAL